MRRIMPLSSCLAGAMLLSAAALPAAAQSWPAKPIRFIIPYQPGGIIDAAARVIAPKITEAWGQQVIIENKPGGNATIGMQYVAKAQGDGYIFVLASLGDFTVAEKLLKDIPYGIARDFVPVAMLTTIPTVLTVGSETPYKTVEELIEAAKKQPGKLSYATPGNGSINHISMESFALNTGTKFQQIPYKGGAPAATAVAAGDLPIGMLTITGAIPFFKSGRIRVIATATPKRLAQWPDVPALAEKGYLKFDGSNWVGMMAPKATPADIVNKMNAEVNKILAMPDVVERLSGAGSTPVLGSAAEFDKRVKAEQAAYAEVVDKAKIEAQ